MVKLTQNDRRRYTVKKVLSVSAEVVRKQRTMKLKGTDGSVG